jgi:hypothetical protein
MRKACLVDVTDTGIRAFAHIVAVPRQTCFVDRRMLVCNAPSISRLVRTSNGLRGHVEDGKGQDVAMTIRLNQNDTLSIACFDWVRGIARVEFQAPAQRLKAKK